MNELYRYLTLAVSSDWRLLQERQREEDKVEFASAAESSGVSVHAYSLVGTRADADLLCDAIFYTPRFRQRSPLAAELGCSMSRKGCVKPGRFEETNIPGLYVAGDASRDVQFLIIAAAEGARAAVGIHKALREEDFR